MTCDYGDCPAPQVFIRKQPCENMALFDDQNKTTGDASGLIQGMVEVSIYYDYICGEAEYINNSRYITIEIVKI